MKDALLVAARRYDARRAARTGEEPVTAAGLAAMAQQRDERQKRAVAINKFAEELTEFMAKQGASTMELLRASGTIIVLGEERATDCAVLYVLCKDGLRALRRPNVTMTLLGVQNPESMPIDPLQAATGAVMHGVRDPVEIMPWLLREIDTIVEQA